MIAVGTTILVVDMHVPGTALAKIVAFRRINSGNPQVAFSNYYQQLSDIASREDWMIDSPISYLFSGLVFGLLASVKRSVAYVLQRAVILSLVLSFFILLLSIVGPFAFAKLLALDGYETPAPSLDFQQLWIGLVQAAYWTVFYLAGSFVGYRFRNRGQATTATRQPAKTVPAQSSK